MIELADIQAAKERLSGVIRTTPVTQRDSLSHLAGRPLSFKGEHLQRTGSYKIRGAYNFISQLPENAAVVAASAGNHAQGVALAASLTNRRATIFMPKITPLPKIEATENHGADIRLVGEVVDDCIGPAQDFAKETGAHFVPPFDDEQVIAGQGTIAMEILEQAPEVSTVVVPIGGGGLISGVATALHYLKPDVKVFGVEAAGAPTMTKALADGKPARLEKVKTMADGIAVRSVSQLTLEHTKAYVEDVFTVSEEQISQAAMLMLERGKMLVEPAAAVGFAGLLYGKIPGNTPALAVLSGGNIDPILLTRLINHGLSAAGRYLVLKVVIDDSPGALATLTTAVAEMGLNILNVEHHYLGLRLRTDEVEVVVTVETRNPHHRQEVVTDLRERGFYVELVS